MAQVGSKNLFEILGEDGEQKPAAQQQTQAAPASNTKQGAKKQAVTAKAIVGLSTKPITRRDGPAPRKDLPFEQQPTHVAEKKTPIDKTDKKKTGGVAKRGNGRDFDRRSGSNKHDTEKKEVAGKGSWGEPVAAELDAAAAPAADAPATPVGEAADDAAAVAFGDEVVVAEPQETFKSLQDFLREKQEAASKGKTQKVRKPNEGADVSALKNAVQLKRTDEIPFAELKEAKKEIKRKEAKNVEYVEFTPKSFAEIQREKENRRSTRGSGPNTRGTGPRTGAPRNSGNGPRSSGNGPRTPREGGRPSGGNPRSSTGTRVNVADTKAFPKLGA